MTSTAPNPARPDHQTPRLTGPEEAARAAQLRAANINPRTGLATDYLNHFNEAIMLLEMIPDMPECAEEFLQWQPRSYREHFAASNFKARELAIDAYNSANPDIRTEFDNITGAITSILIAVSNAMREVQPGQDPRHAGPSGHRLGQAAGDAGRRHHQWSRRRGRHRLHHDALTAVAPPVQPSHPQLAVSAAIFRDDKILLVRRARSPAKGFYSLPGGRVEFGETLHVALHREVDEETALKIEIVGLAGWREVLPETAGSGHYLIMSFAARWVAGEPVLNDELDDFRWLAPDGLGDLEVTAGLQPVIQSARRLLRA